jgi:ribulose bisphosphate carboxylase small subunit
MADVQLSEEALQFIEEAKKNINKVEPVNSGLITNPDEEDFNFWNKAGSLTLSAAQGVVNAVEEQGDFLDENIVSLGGLEFGDKDGKFTFKDLIPKYVSPKKWKEGAYSQQRNLPVFHKPEGIGENLTEGAARFVTGFIGPSKILKGVGLGGNIIKTGLRGLSAGAVADLTVFDPNEGRLADMLVEFDSPVLNNAVTQYLATDEDDTEMEGRLKNVLEGMLIGGPLEILFGVKAFKKAKKTQDIAEKEKIYKETGEAINGLKKKKKNKKVLTKIVEDNKAINTKEYIKKINIGEKEAKKQTESFIKRILNTKSFLNSAEVLKTIDDVSERFDDVTKDYLENDVLKNQTAEELATLLSRNKEEVLKALPKEAAAAKNATVRMLASKQVLQELAFTLKETSEQYVKKFGRDTKAWTKQAKEEVALQSEIIRKTVIALKDQIRGAARTTQAGRIKVARSEGKVLDIEKMVDIIQNFRGDSTTIANLIKDAPLEEVINSVAKTRYQRTIEAFNSLYINSLLSGVFTQAINMKSGIYEAFIRPLEQIGGGLARADVRSIRLGFAQYQGMMMSFGDTIKATGLALKQGDAILDPLARTQDNLEIVGGKAVRPISGANLGFDGAAGTAIDWIGNVIELPSRLLMTGDELLKQMNYRGRLFTNALDNTMERGLSISSKEGKENIKRIFDEGFDKNGSANTKDNSINTKTLDYAREATYTNSLKGGSYLDWGSKIQTFLNNSPEFRFMAPFIRTPTNLWRHFGNRIPGFGLLTKQNRDLWRSGDRRARAEVIGRQFMGMAYAGYGLHLATEDIADKDGKLYPKITGNGPSNFQVKKTWLSMGWQPYSIAQKNEDGSITYKQYNRMDPRFYILGIIADLKENLININDQQKEDIFSSAALTVFRNASNKTYLRGLSDAMELVANPTENSFSKFFGGVVGNAIPYASLRNQGIPGILDPETEAWETRGFLDRIIARSGLGEKYLEPRRDILTGEPIEKTPSSLYLNPDGVASFSFWFQGPSLVGRKIDVKDNPVAFEIARLRVPLGEPQKIKYKTVDLTEYKKGDQSAYDYMMENIGKVKIEGKTLTEYLQKTFDSNNYQSLQEGNTENDGGKEVYIKKIFKGFKDKAYYEMLKEYPEVKDAIEAAQIKKYGLLKRKKGDETEEINVLLPQ